MCLGVFRSMLWIPSFVCTAGLNAHPAEPLACYLNVSVWTVVVIFLCAHGCCSCACRACGSVLICASQ